MSDLAGTRGSVWLRWDPHIHVPGTLLNDQYTGTDPWLDFETRISGSDPKISALGITDYFTLASYEQALARKQASPERWPALVFPNIEMRLGAESAKSSAINIHLLCSPEDPRHIEQAKSFLRHLTFRYKNETYRCDDADLARLGRAYSPQPVEDDRVARQTGANQFKVSFKDLLGAFDASEWARQNMLVAVAASGRDGTASLKEDASFAATRNEIERRADIIFSSQPKQRDFWLGRGAATPDQLREKWGGPKPCLHGSDAHDAEHVGKPDLTRFCWIKGDESFESLRQVCIEPSTRAFIGAEPPSGALSSQILVDIKVEHAPWLKNNHIPLNPGLIAIIGARGSGKTALADMIAAGANSSEANDQSFLRRASDLLEAEQVRLVWGAGETTSASLAEAQWDAPELPRVRYLSQQFVERLCSAKGLATELRQEIQRVIFGAFPSQDRLGASDFDELLQIRCERAQRARSRNLDALRDATRLLATERQKHASVASLRKTHDEFGAGLAKDKAQRTALLAKSPNAETARLDALAAAIEAAKRRIETAKRKERSLTLLKEEVEQVRTQAVPSRLRQLKSDYLDAGLNDSEWSAFDLGFKGDVDQILDTALKDAQKRVRALEGPAEGEREFASGSQDTAPAFIDAKADLADQTLTLLEKENARLHALAGLDAQNAKQVARLSDKIARDETTLAKHREALTDAEGAEGRIQDLLGERAKAYEGVFDALVAEEKELVQLYAPLAKRLDGQTGALAKLGFAVRRTVDTLKWATDGERLLDLRTGPFRGRGSLRQAADDILAEAWREGSAGEVAAAMVIFRDKHEQNLRDHMPEDMRLQGRTREWASKVAEWLFSTAHIGLAYSIQYDGVDIEQLSPGTRGIVLLLLYLALDSDDERPLIIDQPEENLDPKSVHEELVERFREARLRRQIIIVTHNANLVVNTDADQVIVAHSGPHKPDGLPEITYKAGGLEDAAIRELVCEILEGGEAAFRDRAKRLRLSI